MRRPATGPRRRKDVITFSKLLTEDEQQQFMVYLKKRAVTVRGKGVYLICDILLNTGLRIVELAALRVQDTPLVLNENVIEVYMGKGRKDRSIPVSQRLADAIRNYIKKVRPKTLPRHIRRGDVTKPVFYSRNHRPYLQRVTIVNKKTGEYKERTRASTALYKAIHILAMSAGITKLIHPHMFRHTFAVNALKSGIDIYRLCDLMGHSDITITAKYLHIVDTQPKKLGERLDRYFDYLF